MPRGPQGSLKRSLVVLAMLGGCGTVLPFADRPVLSRCAAEQPAAAAPDTASAQRDAAWLERMRRSREALAWTDEAVRHEWRLQRRPGSSDWRLLGPEERVRCMGSAAECRAAFDAAAGPPVTGDVVVLLHGLGEGRDSMRPLAKHLRTTVDATVLSYGYASVKAGIDDHAEALGRCVADLPQARRISFVGHSLGGLVIRRWHAIAAADTLARVHRVVMLGSPNQGSDLARMAARVWGVAATADGAARDLLVEWDKIAPRLAVPACDLGIIAGGKQDDVGYSGLLAGDDDAVVRVAETRLDGADDFLVVPVHHAAMMRHPEVQRATAAFLETGRFHTSATPAPAASP